MADFGSLAPDDGMMMGQGQAPTSDPTADILRRLLFMRSGQMQAPPETPEMTRALPGYEQRDPNELAMLRHREMVRPQAGRADFPIEHVANMASAAAALSPVGAALSPEYLAGRAVAAGAQYAPKLTAGGLGLGGAMAPSLAGGAEDPQAVKTLQMQLRDAGYYRGEIDGKMGPGTQRAQAEFTAAETARKANELREKELANTAGANTATLETARANQATAETKREADRLQAERDTANLARKQAGDERMKNIDKNRSLGSVIMQDYAGPAGYAAGALLGIGGRGVSSMANNAMSRGRAVAGDAIINSPIAGKGAAANIPRVARANEFWRAGGAKEVPFTQSPTKAPGFEVNPKATSLSDIYSPNIHPAVEAGVAAVPIIESGTATYLKGGAEESLAQALKDYQADPSEANIQRIQTARDNVGLYSGAENAGRMWAGSHLVGAAASRYGKVNANMRPNMAPAEQEQLALQKILRDAQEKAAKAAAKKGGPVILQPPLPSAPPLNAAAVQARNGVPYGMLNAP